MANEGFKRKLTAILSADVVEYSRLMGEDEEDTVRTLTAYREVFTKLIQQHNGRVLDSPGDNLLSEFVSIVDAVKCAVAVQKEIKARNDELSENRRMQFRIGINLGDVIQEGERIYGDGVNIAARLEGLSYPGGICISEIVHNQIEDKLSFEYEYMGEKGVKNISKPVHVYRVLAMAEDNSPDRGIELEMADKPSIAVLPFVNMSGDPTQEYFSDGLTEQIITGISKIPKLFVIARNSTFTYKGRAVKAQQVGQELHVRYILEGSVQRSGERVRITSQLIDANTGRHLWAENFDRDLEDIFDLQDEITMEIMGAMRIELTEGEQARLYVKGETKNIKAFELAYRGLEYQYKMTPHDNAQAIQLIEEAISLDSHYAIAHCRLAHCHAVDFYWNWSSSPLESFSLSEQSAQKALELNDALDIPYMVLGLIYIFKKQFNEAIENCEKAVSLNPNGADAHAFLGLVLFCSDSIRRSIVHLKKAMRLNPIPPIHYWTFMGGAYRMAGQYEKAIEYCKKVIQKRPDHFLTNLILTAAYSQAEMGEKACQTAFNVTQIMPSFSLENYSKIIPYKNQSELKKYIEALRKAGLPD
jgi:adenylate cyclase